MDYESIRVHANMETMESPDAVFIHWRPHQASIPGGVQLSVSVIAAFGGAVFPVSTYETELRY